MSNALINERSPYLKQHAQNPVDWLPWGEAAFEKARREDKPVFLSIGYSTCHWCHVMAHESFEDGTVAEAVNRDFIPSLRVHGHAGTAVLPCLRAMEEQGRLIYPYFCA